MKLEIGMYVRTKRGQIGKIITIGEYNIAIEFNKMWQDIILKENIIKASLNIIDLIEVGDYVNGERVVKIYEKGDVYNKYVFTKTIIETDNDNYETIPHDHLYSNCDIRSIVTKEHFEQIAYKVGE